ncbi:MAG: hypothetical protein H5U40_08445, partial [Polyangiaceae bacterium]|nr:hypothetical protein [Polyangiaceae bacterium]
MIRSQRFGAGTFLSALVVAAHLVAFLTGLATATVWVPLLAAHPERLIVVASALAAESLFTFLVSAAALRSVNRTQPGLRGRSRLKALFVSGELAALGSGFVLGLVAYASTHSMLGFVHTLAPSDLVSTMGRRGQVRLYIWAGIGVGSTVVALLSLIASWFLLPLRGRRTFFFAFDVAIVTAAAYMFFAFPSEPASGAASDLVKPVLRLAAMSTTGFRIALR